MRVSSLCVTQRASVRGFAAVSRIVVWLFVRWGTLEKLNRQLMFTVLLMYLFVHT